MKMVYAGSVGTPAALNKPASKGSISGHGEGVYSLCLDNDGGLYKKSVCYSDNAGIICMSNDKKYIYAANESKDFTGLNGSGGGVTAFRIDSKTKELVKINDSVSYGSRTSYVSISEDGKFLLASNHGSHTTVTCHYVQDRDGNWILNRGFDDSSIAVFRINDDGSIGALTDLKVFEGHGYWGLGRGQSTSHIHSVRIKNGFVFAGNRGADEIEVMHLDETTGKLEILSRYHTRKGYAPRHIDFHPNSNFIYVTNENYPCVSVFKFDILFGKLEEVQVVNMMPDDYYIKKPLPNFSKDVADSNETNTSSMGDQTSAMPSDIHVSHNGRFVYSSSRMMKGIAHITVHRVNSDFTLTLVDVFPLHGKDARGFNIFPDDKHLIVGLLDTDKVYIYSIDQSSGCLVDIESVADIPSTASFAIAE